MRTMFFPNSDSTDLFFGDATSSNKQKFFLLFLFLLGGAKVRENEIQYQFKAEEGVIED